MGLNSNWKDEVFTSLRNIHHQVEIVSTIPFHIINCSSVICLHLIPIDNDFQPSDLIDLKFKYKQDNIHLVQLWQDVWLSKKQQVINRIYSLLGLNKTFYARKASVLTISLADIKSFLNKNHLQGYVKAKYNFGLIVEGKIIAVASFSDTRKMKLISNDYLSAELVRFASKDGLTIVGGLSKFIKHFLKEVKVNDLMTYADQDWSLGKGYDKLGFVLTSQTPPAYLYLDKINMIRYFPHRLPKKTISGFEKQDILNLEDYLAANNYFKIFNTGNLKYHLYR